MLDEDVMLMLHVLKRATILAASVSLCVSAVVVVIRASLFDLDFR